MYLENSIQYQAFEYALMLRERNIKAVTVWPAMKTGRAHTNKFRYFLFEYLLSREIKQPEAKGWRENLSDIRLSSMHTMQSMLERQGYTINEYKPEVICISE